MRRYDIAEHKDEIITHIIKNLIWLPIAAVVPIMWSLLKWIYDSLFTNQSPNTWIIFLSIISLLLSLFAIFFIYCLYKKLKNNTQNTKQETESLESDEDKEPKIIHNYQFESIEAEMVFDSRENITSTIDYKMIVLAEEVTEMNRELIWSGDSYKGTKLVQKNGDYEIIDSQRNSSPYRYTINFNDVKKRGSKIEFKTQTTVTDNKLNMTPVYSFMVKYQINRLKLCVIVPKGLIKNVKKSVYVDRAREVCVSQPENIRCENVGNLRKYVFEIENPSLLYTYFIEWEFTK